MKRYLLIIVILALLPIIVLAQDGRVELSYNVQADVNFVDYSIIIKEKVNGGEKIYEPSHQGRSGYVFLGWFNGEERWDFENDVVTSHLTLTAKYREEDTIFSDMTDSADNIFQPSLSFDLDDINVSDDEKEYLADDHVINIWVEVRDISDSITNAEKEKIDNLAKKDNLDVDYYLDIDLFKEIDGIDGTKEQIYSTNNKIKVTLTLPENMREKNRKYHVIRLHDGKAEEIYSGFPDENWKLVFETNKFSSYAIAHSDFNNGNNPKTADNISFYVWILLINYIVLVLLLFLKKREI